MAPPPAHLQSQCRAALPPLVVQPIIQVLLQQQHVASKVQPASIRCVLQSSTAAACRMGAIVHASRYLGAAHGEAAAAEGLRHGPPRRGELALLVPRGLHRGVG